MKTPLSRGVRHAGELFDTLFGRELADGLKAHLLFGHGVLHGLLPEFGAFAFLPVAAAAQSGRRLDKGAGFPA